MTPTAKVAASPIRHGIKGGDSIDFTPLVQFEFGWKPLTAPLLRERLADTLGRNVQGESVHQLAAETERIAGA